MAEIATWRAIYKKLGWGKVSDECPTKAEILAKLNAGHNPNTSLNAVISNADSYGDNECVKLEDLHTEQWKYEFKWIRDPSFDAPATGGEFLCGLIESWRVKYVDGVILPDTKEELTWEQGIEPSNGWYTKKEVDGVCKRFVPNNTTFDIKTTVVSWKQKYSDISLRATFTQAAGRKVYSSWSYNCRVDKTSFSYSGGQSNVTAKSASRSYTWNGQGSSYTESETATVRVSSPASISGNSISIPSNSGSARNFTVTFYFPTATDQTISISQEGGQVTYVDHLSIDPTTKNVSGTGSEFRLTVNANYDKYINGTYVENIRTHYTSAEVVEGTSSDITISGKSSSGCSISVAPNPNSSPRTFKIKFTYDTATPVYLTITQNSAEVTYPSSGMVFEHSTQQSSGYKTSTLSIGTVGGEGGNISFYIKSYRSRYVNGSLSSTEAIKPTLILPSGVIESITNVGGKFFEFKVTLTILEHSKPASRTLTIRANQPNGLDRELVQTVQQSASTYEFYIRKTTSDPWSTGITYDNWPGNDGFMDGPCIIRSLKNGKRFTNWGASSNVDWITIQDDGSTIRYTVAINNSSSSRTGIITFTQGESNKTCTLTIVQEAGDVYEFYITDSDGNGHYTDFTFSAPSDGLVNKHVFNLISTHNGSPLSIDDMEEVHSEIKKEIGLVLTQDTQSPFGFIAFINKNGYTERTGADTYRQKPSGKTVIFRVLQEAKINKFRLELSLNISNSNDQDTWGLFDTANMPHTSDFMYAMNLIREGIIVDSVEGKITVNSIQSTTKDRGIGDNVYVWAYNSVRGLWLSIGNFRIEEGNNTHHWDVSWPT